MTIQRIPLQDICGGPRCRFFQEYPPSYKAGYYTMFSTYLYDKSEPREVEVEGRRYHRSLFGEKAVATRNRESMVFYHIACTVFRSEIRLSTYCASFHSSICLWPTKAESQDFWAPARPDKLADGAEGQHAVTFPYEFAPIEDLPKYLVNWPEWHDGKCPSFVPYPVEEVKV